MFGYGKLVRYTISALPSELIQSTTMKHELKLKKLA